MQSHIRKVYACLAVTCHLHFWRNDRGLLRAPAVTRGFVVHRKLFTCTACCLAENAASLCAAWLFAGCDLCKQNRDRQSPLFLASQKGNEEIVVHLLAVLPRPLVFTTLSAIPVHAAAKQGHAHILQLLAEGGCDINQVSTVGCRVSTVGCRVGTVGCQENTVGCQMSIVVR